MKVMWQCRLLLYLDADYVTWRLLCYLDANYSTWRILFYLDADYAKCRLLVYLDEGYVTVQIIALLRCRLCNLKIIDLGTYMEIIQLADYCFA